MPNPKRIKRQFLVSGLDSTDKTYLKAEFIRQLHNAYRTEAVQFSQGFVVELTERVVQFRPPQNDVAQNYQRRASALLGDVLQKDKKLRAVSYGIVSREITELGKGCSAALVWVPAVKNFGDQPVGEDLICQMVDLACPFLERTASKTAQEGLVHLSNVHKRNAFKVLSCLRERTEEIIENCGTIHDANLNDVAKVWTSLAKPCREQLSIDDAVQLYHIVRDCDGNQHLSHLAFSALASVCVARNDLYNFVQKAMHMDVEQDNDSRCLKRARDIEAKLNTVMVDRMLTETPTFPNRRSDPDAKIRAMSNYLLSLQG
ncbi:MAG: hypothetical protein EOM37_07340 [Proteobacteria bacterium]|nr:hypothetical protein [Pseudomonadota bacterium]